MRLTKQEEKDLRNLVTKEVTDRPLFLTQEEGGRLFEEIDSLRKEQAAAVKHSESLVKKYKDDKISQTMESMQSELSLLRGEIGGLRDFLSTAKSMLQRTTRIECVHGGMFYSTSSVQATCEKCEIIEHLVGMIDKVEKSTV